jgi:glycosyltransferase involved in cell wall biosynthesis/ubiquinone/menaquinone biosynthesis C-methylase UbiE
LTQTYLYVAPNLGEVGAIETADLAAAEDRHKVSFTVPTTVVCLQPRDELGKRTTLSGVVIGLDRGWPGPAHLRFATAARDRGLRVWFFWPQEKAVEHVDGERLVSFWRHWVVITLHRVRAGINRRIWGPEPPPDPAEALAERVTSELKPFIANSSPVPLPEISEPPAEPAVDGIGLYLRTDFWVQITSGGSYGHTCYVAKELAATSGGLVCLMANRYPLLDEMGLHQIVVPTPSDSSHERDLLGGTSYTYPILKVAMQAIRPSYIYERLCLGNYAGALVSRELGIPYIVEYNGSEISMRRSFDGGGFVYERAFTRAEEAAFKQATLITVVSDAVGESLIARGVDRDKVLVNPNGADPVVYSPPSPDLRRSVRSELGFGPDDRVIGFSGTFGGWHGVDVLAEALPRICAASSSAKFLLIGDGAYKHLVDDAVIRHGLADRVKSMGRVAQNEGARLLKACDIFVSPHSSHMVDSRFFGSPTKLFEYMAMAGGIVASDLEQLGEVLSPALRPEQLSGSVTVSDQRAILCKPGDVDQFVTAVTFLAESPSTSEALGRNARQAVLDHYSWRRHVERIWQHAAGETRRASQLAGAFGSAPARLDTGDAYKEQVQNQWNSNPVGPQYAKVHRPHTLEWYQEIEAHRYGVYGPWMLEVMEFTEHRGHDLLEIGAGIGTDLSQFARHGANVTDLDLSAGHMAHARENFALRGLTARFVHHDAERLPFDDNSFDVVYSNGVLHHTPNTRQVVAEIKRVLRPGGKAIVMMYAEDSLHYWLKLVWQVGLNEKRLLRQSMHDIMSETVEITANDAKPLVKVYSRRRLRELFTGFDDISIVKRQLMAVELPDWLKWMPLTTAERLMGWNLIVKARKPRA